MDDVWNEISLSSYLRPFSVPHHYLNLHDFIDHHPFSNTIRQPPLNDGGAPVTALRLASGSGAALYSPPPAKKRVLVVVDANEDERHKRLMKNRESADRSRARKQAYTAELEKDVARLRKENAKLKGQLQTISSEGYAQIPKKHTLRRTLTAPF